MDGSNTKGKIRESDGLEASLFDHLCKHLLSWKSPVCSNNNNKNAFSISENGYAMGEAERKAQT